MLAITASNGKLGQAVIAELQNQNVEPSRVRLTARSTEKLGDLSKLGFEIARADYDDPASMVSAFTGIDTLLLISGAGPNEVRIANHRSAIDSAKKTGVKKIIYTSFTNPTPQSKFIWAAPHVDTEAYIKASGLPHIILRDNQYASNLDSLLAQAKENGVFAIPGAKGKVAYITHEDVASAIVAVLTGKGQDNTIYELTGPETFNANDIAEVLSAELGKEISMVDASLDSFKEFFRSIGMPEFVVDGLSSIYVASGDGEYSEVSNDVNILTGKSATSLRDYIKRILK